MLFCDNRIGSKDLADPLRKMGLEVELTRLDYADVAFEGKGNEGRPVFTGVELKKLPDLITSLRDGRLAGHQALGLVSSYDYRWLLAEGQYKPDKHGQLLVPNKHGWAPAPGSMTVSELEKRILTMELLGGLRVRHTQSRFGTLHFIAALYRWFTDTSMDRHTTHIVDHEPQGLIQLSDFRRAVMKWPGIGTRTSAAVEKHFMVQSTKQASIRAAANATVEEWTEITTMDRKGKPRRLGTKVAQQIVRFCRGE